MRPTTKSEKILLLILFAIAFFGANYIGYNWIAKKQSALELKYLDLKGDRADAEVDLSRKDLWAKRRAWIQEHQPVISEEDGAKAEVQQFVVKAARDNKLEVLDQSLNDATRGASGTRVNLTIKVKGPMEGLCHWIADLQKPEKFYAVSTFSLKADQDQKSMICTLQVARYFKPGAGS